MAPLIGICAAIERVSWGVWVDQEVVMAPRNYAGSVQAAGAIAVVLPPDRRALEDSAPFVDRIDGLLLAGGADVDPSSYGAEAGPATTGTWPERDRFEVALANAALDRGMPILGICRGMQVLNVACGGTLEQNLPDVVGSQRHREVAGRFSDHDVRLDPGSLAARATGGESAAVKSHHHQGVDRLGAGLVVSGHADDGVVEAVERPDRGFTLGVLWHPEEDEASRVIAALVDAARASSVAGRQSSGVPT